MVKRPKFNGDTVSSPESVIVVGVMARLAVALPTTLNWLSVPPLIPPLTLKLLSVSVTLALAPSVAAGRPLKPTELCKVPVSV